MHSAPGSSEESLIKLQLASYLKVILPDTADLSSRICNANGNLLGNGTILEANSRFNRFWLHTLLHTLTSLTVCFDGEVVTKLALMTRCREREREKEERNGSPRSNTTCSWSHPINIPGRQNGVYLQPCSGDILKYKPSLISNLWHFSNNTKGQSKLCFRLCESLHSFADLELLSGEYTQVLNFWAWSVHA